VEPLRLAIASVQAQSLQDFELFVVGDGVADPTRELIGELGAKDSRIRFFDFAKGPRKGEVHRHEALRHARGRIVAYLGDDDYWMPDHLEVLDALLVDADFGHTMHVGVNASDELFAFASDLENPRFRDRMLTELIGRFDFSFAGHTLEAYRRLPHGWRTTPASFPYTDLYMWRQFLAEPWCWARSAMLPTAICTHTHLRPHLSDQARAAHLAYWSARSREPGFRELLWRKVGGSFARDACYFEIRAERCKAKLRATLCWRVAQILRGIRRRVGAISGQPARE
jgi:glycosyltransferase involved in cell wall biosynthesis